MLFTDSDIVTALDMVAIDSEMQSVARLGGSPILVDGDAGIIRQNWQECANKVRRVVQSFAANAYAGDPVMGFHMANFQARIGLNQLSLMAKYAKADSPWKRWMTLSALAMFYDAASNSRTGAATDRFLLKEQKYDDMAATAWSTAIADGLPVLASPLSAPGATHDYTAGTWGPENISSAVSGSAASATYYVAITWVDGSAYISPTVKGNAESAPSLVVTFEVPANSVMVVNIVSMNPPGSVVYPGGVSDGVYRTRKATGWNVYAGATSGLMTLQNPTPITASVPTFTFPAAPTTTGAPMGAGQFPDQLTPILNQIYRA